MMKPFGDRNLRRRAGVHNAWHVVACVCDLALVLVFGLASFSDSNNLHKCTVTSAK
ncbi:uncharacterized protein K441DRAFT_84220 [Cenococcum geophilum 1.58]|uniref:uncharacterized protein n=1 Tax=Cenococcum geophilum 1.58 TaxID=794803 RepID=UPI00358EDB7F|nr:hypothetical protein K441DRAFT_84220 [Cenococcum geophilum 1.58]